MDNTLGRIARTLQGMGAGAMGRGNEWRYNQDVARMEQQLIEEERRKAYIADTMNDISSVYELVESGQIGPAREVIHQGIMKAQRFGDTNSEWLAYADMLDNGQVQRFRNELGSDVVKLVGGNHMPAPPTYARKQERKKNRQDLKDKAKFAAPPDRVQMWEYMKNLPPEEQEAFRTMVGGGVTVNTGNQNPADPYAGKRNELAIDENQSIYLRGADARQAIPRYNLALSLLDQVETGPLTERINAAKKYGQAFGFDVDPEKVANYEQLAPIFGKLTMEKIQETKGSVSNKEMEMFERMNANYQYSTEGNKKLIKFAKSRAERDVEIRALIRDMRKDGASPVDISEAVDMYIQQNDMSDMLQSLIGNQKQVGRFTIEEG